MHTPGPWTTLHGYVVTADPDGSVKLNSRIIVPLREQRAGSMFEASASDTALICAAPALAAALAPFAAELVSEDAMCHRGLCSMQECGRCSRILAARAALAKARGVEAPPNA